MSSTRWITSIRSCAFRDNEQVGFLSTPVYKYYQLLVPEDGASRTALAFSGGDPMIVESRVGRGRSIMVATSAGVGPRNAPWTAMPMLQNFLPLVRELLAEAVAGQFDQRNLEVGQPLEGVTRAAAGAGRMKIVTPAGEADQVEIRRAGELGHWRFDGTALSGAYRAEAPHDAGIVESFAVNVDTRESDLTKLELDELRGEVWKGVPFIHRTNWQNLDDQPAVEIVQRGYLHWWLLCGVVVLLLVETCLAYVLGKQNA